LDNKKTILNRNERQANKSKDVIWLKQKDISREALEIKLNKQILTMMMNLLKRYLV